MRLLEVGRVLERLALPNAAVYHTGEMHCHGGGGCHGSQQWLRNKRERSG